MIQATTQTSQYDTLPPTHEAEQAPPIPMSRTGNAPMFTCDGDGECNVSLIQGIAISILFLSYGVGTCCDCCSGDCLDICTYQKLPICKAPLEPNTDMDILPETSSAEIQTKLEAARSQLHQLDQTLSTRRKAHRCASTLFCPIVCLPRTIACFLRTDDSTYNQNRLTPPQTKLDLAYQFTLPLLKQDIELGRRGLRQFLSPPEAQRMIDLESTIIPNLQGKAS